MDTDFVFNNLAELVLAIEESEKLTKWFGELSALPASERKDSVQRMANEMTAEGEPASVVTSLWLLANPAVFGAVKVALAEGEED